MAKARYVIGLGLVLAAGGGAAWYWHDRPITVQVAQAQLGAASQQVYATGYVEAQQPVSVSSRITAPVAKVLVDEGASVKRGQALVLLAADEQRGLLDQARAQQRSAEVVEKRSLALFRDGWVTAAARDNATTAADAARAASATARARLDQLVVRANSDGIVTKRDVYPGDLATPTKVLFQLGDPARIRITATVDERDITRVAVGQKALMSSDALPGQAIPAHVSEVTPGGDPTARAFRVRLLPDGAGALPMGLTLEVNIITRERKAAVLVPATALTSDGAHVWVVTQGRAAPRTITKGANGTDKVEIAGGLRAGETVILNPPADLQPGQRLRPANP